MRGTRRSHPRTEKSTAILGFGEAVPADTARRFELAQPDSTKNSGQFHDTRVHRLVIPTPPLRITMNPRSGSSAAVLANIDHIVTLLFENRSLDHMLGFLYTDEGNVSPAGHPFAGLTGEETCPDGSGKSVGVYKIDSSTPNAYFMPGADPGEGYAATNNQLYGSTAVPPEGAVAPMTGFVTDYEFAIAANKSKNWYVVPGTTPQMIMGCYTDQTLPVLHALAKGYAVCDHWFGSAPTMTMPNRAFACAGTSQGHMDDMTKTYTAPSIFGRMSKHNVRW